MGIVKRKLLLVTIAVADPGEAAWENSDNAGLELGGGLLAKYH